MTPRVTCHVLATTLMRIDSARWLPKVTKAVAARLQLAQKYVPEFPAARLLPMTAGLGVIAGDMIRCTPGDPLADQFVVITGADDAQALG